MCVDRTFSDNQRLDIYCLLCGARKYVSKSDSIFGAWLAKKEESLSNSYLA